jgi:hypothetical protein
MGDTFQELVANVDPETAANHRSALLSWLVSDGVVSEEASDCVLGETEGHAPGPNYRLATGTTNETLFDLVTNGMTIETGRIVAVDPQSEVAWVCDGCGRRIDDTTELFQQIGAWYKGKDDAFVVCPFCSANNEVVRIRAEPALACGTLAIVFWNWSPLTPQFIAAVGRQLSARISVVTGKL